MQAFTATTRIGLLLPISTFAVALMGLTFLVVTAAGRLVTQTTDMGASIVATEAPQAAEELPQAEAPSAGEGATGPQPPQFRFAVPQRSPIQPAVYFEPFVVDEDRIERWRI